jgi:hypothetical protein
LVPHLDKNIVVVVTVELWVHFFGELFCGFDLSIKRHPLSDAKHWVACVILGLDQCLVFFFFFFFTDNFCRFHYKQNNREIIGFSFYCNFLLFFSIFQPMLSLLSIIVFFNVKGTIKRKKILDSPTLKLSGFFLYPICSCF